MNSPNAFIGRNRSSPNTKAARAIDRALAAKKLRLVPGRDQSSDDG
jgi:hypothetical protein